MQWFFLSDTQEQVPVNEEHIAGLVQTGVIRPNTMMWREGMPQWIAASEVKPELFANKHVVPVVGAAATARQTAALRPSASPAAPAAAATGQMHPASAAAPTTGVLQNVEASTVREIAHAFAKASGWMKLIAVFFILGGVLYILMALLTLVSGMSVEGGLIPSLLMSLVTAGLGGVVLWMGTLLFQAPSKAQLAERTGQKHPLLSAMAMNGRFFKIWGISIIAVLVLYGLIIALFFSIIAASFGAVSVFDNSTDSSVQQQDDTTSPEENDNNSKEGDANEDEDNEFDGRIDEDPDSDEDN